MHYKNGRPAKVTDWVYGPNHSGDMRCVGVIIELMENQGNCSARILAFPSYETRQKLEPGDDLVGLPVGWGKRTNSRICEWSRGIRRRERTYSCCGWIPCSKGSFGRFMVSYRRPGKLGEETK